MRKTLVLSILFIVSGMSCTPAFRQSLEAAVPKTEEKTTNDKEKSGLKQLNWLADDWVLLKNGAPTRMYESWHYMNDSLMQGRSFTVHPSGDTTLNETIDLILRGNDISYIPTVSGQNNNAPVPFQLTTREGMSWTFENPEHDFPTRIRYTLAGYDTLHAEVSGPGKEINFVFLRQARIQRFTMPGEDGTVTMRKFWLLSYLSGPNRSHSKEETDQIQAGHMAHLTAIYKAGKSCVAGPTDGRGEVRGFVVYTTGTREEATYLASLDPAVQAGRLTFTLEAWWAMEGAVLK